MCYSNSRILYWFKIYVAKSLSYWIRTRYSSLFDGLPDLNGYRSCLHGDMIVPKGTHNIVRHYTDMLKEHPGNLVTQCHLLSGTVAGWGPKGSPMHGCSTFMGYHAHGCRPAFRHQYSSPGGKMIISFLREMKVALKPIRSESLYLLTWRIWHNT